MSRCSPPCPRTYQFQLYSWGACNAHNMGRTGPYMASSPCKTVCGSFKVEGARVKEGASGGCLGRLTCLGALRLLCLACSYPSFAPPQKLCSDCPAATWGRGCQHFSLRFSIVQAKEHHSDNLDSVSSAVLWRFSSSNSKSREKRWIPIFCLFSSSLFQLHLPELPETVDSLVTALRNAW